MQGLDDTTLSAVVRYGTLTIRDCTIVINDYKPTKRQSGIKLFQRGVGRFIHIPVQPQEGKYRPGLMEAIEMFLLGKRRLRTGRTLGAVHDDVESEGIFAPQGAETSQELNNGVPRVS